MIPEQNCLKPPRKDARLDSMWSATQDLVQAVSAGTTAQLGLMLRREGSGQRNPVYIYLILGKETM